MTAKRVTRAVALIALWACGTTAATWVVNDRGEAGPLEVLTVQPAHATPTVPDPINPATRAQAQREDALTAAADRVHLLQAAALLDAARKATTTTTTVVRAAPRPAVAPRPVSGDGCGGWRDLVDNYAWDVTKACRILLCESGGRPDAVGPWTRYGRAQGLMQILPGGSFDPATNMAQAWSKYEARGWSPWVCQ